LTCSTEPNSGEDWIGFAILCFSFFYFVCPFLTLILIFRRGLDPFGLFTLKLLKSFPFLKLFTPILLFIRIYLCVICVFGSMQVLVLVIISVLILLYNFLTLAKSTYLNLTKPGFRVLSKYFIIYSELQKLFTMFRFQETMTAILMAIGVVLTVLANYVYIRMFSEIPFVFYIIFPVLSLIGYLVIYLTISRASQLGNYMVVIIRRKIQQYAGLRGRSYYSKRSIASSVFSMC